MAEAHRIPKRNVSQISLPPLGVYSPQLTSLIAALHQESAGHRRPARLPARRRSVAVEEAADHPAGRRTETAPRRAIAPVYYVPAALLYKLLARDHC